jgi:hypothetical protein
MELNGVTWETSSHRNKKKEIGKERRGKVNSGYGGVQERGVAGPRRPSRPSSALILSLLHSQAIEIKRNDRHRQNLHFTPTRDGRACKTSPRRPILETSTPRKVGSP